MVEKYKSYNINNFETIPQHPLFDKQMIEDVKIVGDIYPFKTNNYVLNKLINWENMPDDPMFRLNFPHRNMLREENYDKLKWGKVNMTKEEYADLIQSIRLELNPHPAGQSSLNIPFDNGEKIEGIQHKYHNTVLFFPSHGQTCHAYCTFCFRWPQFIADNDLKFQAKELSPLINYLNANEQITDVLITGGDPMIMNSKILASYLEPLSQVKSLKTIRIGTKSLSFWPHKFLGEADSEGILNLFKKVIDGGIHLAIMAHFNHPVELESAEVAEAIHKIKLTGAQIRTQAPLLRHINNDADVWATMWQKQVELGCVPYYMFLPRDTGAQQYFAESLDSALSIYRTAIRKVSGLARTAKGPVMSVTNGKVELLDSQNNEYTLRYLQHRDQDLAYQLFKGVSDSDRPKWITDLIPVNPSQEIFFK